MLCKGAFSYSEFGSRSTYSCPYFLISSMDTPNLPSGKPKPILLRHTKIFRFGTVALAKAANLVSIELVHVPYSREVVLLKICGIVLGKAPE